MGNSILFVCTGNTCRSPMAEAYFNFLARNSGHSAVSAGLYVNPLSTDMAEYSRIVLTENNILRKDNAGLFKPIQINEEIVKNSTAIYGITQNHSRRLRQLYPESEDKIFSLSVDVDDPFGGSLESYRKAFEKIREAVNIIWTSQ